MGIAKRLIDEVVNGKSFKKILDEMFDPSTEDFKFVCNDGREGYGATAWKSIVDAIGVAESQALPELRDGSWSISDKDGFFEMQEVYTQDDPDTPIGVMYKR